MLKSIFRLALAGVVLACSLNVAFAESTRAARMKAAYADWAADAGVQGASLAIIEKGKVTETLGIGSYDADESVPLASLSKAVTAVCVVLLADAGQLSLKDTISELLPDYFAANPPIDDAIRDIKVSELITHSSGLGYDPTQGAAFHAFQPFDKPSLAAQFQVAAAEPLGKKTYFYNNANYIALGLIIEAVTGETFDAYCGRTVLDPVGITTAKINTPIAARGPYGSWMMSVGDYARFMAYLEPTGRLLPLRIWDWPRASAGDGVYYALGAYIRENGKSYNVWHSGALDWGPPINLSYGSYRVQYASGTGYVAAYEPAISSDQLNALSQAMGKAAR